MHEAQLHGSALFVTLTYNDENCPLGLEYKDIQLFLKRLRNSRGHAVRFFVAGEYGEQTLRPHWHMILYGVKFADAKVYSERKKHTLWTSAELDQLWKKGFCNFGTVTFQSAQYVASYVVKKVSGDLASKRYARLDPKTGEVVQVAPEMAHMSTKPGIGFGWFEKYHADVYGQSKDHVTLEGGRKLKPPKYYDKLMKKKGGDLWEDIEHRRANRTPAQIAEMEESRLKVREAVKIAQLNFRKQNRKGLQ